ncbi:ABC transporter permease [Salinirubellus salinus]|uniref:ABC transporter permease n=1 Tax=Salinirubellus salinus TaxID=1364945 RepID=A0A9E7U3A7_9EURY|nr:ABC transporter permease [Salinirubellus salinus]UWM53040.1 ABC transporter permease [Salinirubellus salinus]
MSRWRYFARRVILAIPVLLFSTSLTFLIIRAGPIDPVSAVVGLNPDPSFRIAVAESIGIIEANCVEPGQPEAAFQACRVPLWQQYIDFMTGLFRFELGQSYNISRGTPVAELIATRAPVTIWLGFWSVLVAIFIGIPLGFYAGLHPNTLSDYTASFGGIVWRAMPNFWLGIIIVALLVNSETLTQEYLGFAFDWSTWIFETKVTTAPPLENLGDPAELGAAIKQILPAALVLGSASMGNEMRIGRTAVLETINSNYVETARAKGLGPRSIVWKHVFRNALIPLVPIITAEAFLLLGGSVIVERVFGINGMGELFLTSVLQGDLPVAGSLIFIFILITLSINILQDFLYTVIDPRIGYE